MLRFRIKATAIHCTNDSHCVSVEIPKKLPIFFVDAKDVHDAEEIARSIVCPFDLEYEHVKVEVYAETA